MSDKTTVRLFEFLAVPAHAWLWCVAKLLGGYVRRRTPEELKELERRQMA